MIGANLFTGLPCLSITNFEKIVSDEEFYYYTNKIESLYNYNNIHKDHKIDGHDLGGAVLIDANGKPLL